MINAFSIVLCDDYKPWRVQVTSLDTRMFQKNYFFDTLSEKPLSL